MCKTHLSPLKTDAKKQRLPISTFTYKRCLSDFPQTNHGQKRPCRNADRHHPNAVQFKPTRKREDAQHQVFFKLHKANKEETKVGHQLGLFAWEMRQKVAMIWREINGLN